MNYWVGQKVHSDFSITAYGKTRTNFVSNPILAFTQKACLVPFISVPNVMRRIGPSKYVAL